MKNLLRLFFVFALLLFGWAVLPTWAAEEVAGGYHLKYSVAVNTVSVAGAVTPYDANPPAKEAFLHWFKRGFEQVLTGKPPLMIEWDVTPEARAGQRGYDLGRDEAAKYLKKAKETRQSSQTIQISPA